MLIKNFQKILFQGDSITDSDRIRIGNDLGIGYVFICDTWLKKLYPNLKIETINRGISGNTIFDLKDRWVHDCLILEPHWLTILIGINDCFKGITDEEYERIYREILTITKQNIKHINIILMEPFLLPINSVEKKFVMSVENKCDIVRSLVKKFNTLFIPLNDIFKKLSKIAPAHYWTSDGVHPTPQGHFVIAENWLKIVKAI
jgi:lysophospholipase L1-like esterase